MSNGNYVAPDIEIERIAQELHEAGRSAVQQGATVAHEKFGEPVRRFIEWSDLTENAREGRRIQARFLLERYIFIHRN